MSKILLSTALAILLFFTNVYAQTGIITTLINSPLSTRGEGMLSAITLDKKGDIYFNVNTSVFGGFSPWNRVYKLDNRGITTLIAGGGSDISFIPGPAIGVTFYDINGLSVDTIGNVFVGNFGFIAKIDTMGMATVYAGGGASFADGVAATNAQLGHIGGMTVDKEGNLYYTDFSSDLVRKINTAGIITTVAGNGSLGNTTASGPATSLPLEPIDVKVDTLGNVYIANFANVKKVDTFGNITTIAGSDTNSTSSGDGGPATAAMFVGIAGLVLDKYNNIYISDMGNINVIRKVDPITGIIKRVAGSTNGYSGMGGPALLAEMGGTSVDGMGNPIAVDTSGNLFITDDENNIISKVNFNSYANNDSMTAFITPECSGPQITLITTNSEPGLSVVTYFGDGTSATVTLLDSISPVDSSSISYSIINHTYPLTGTYTIKQVLYSGGVPEDSLTYSYNYVYCSVLPLAFYYDANGDSVKESTEPYLMVPVTVEVDSNGIPVDTFSATSGYNYNAYGTPGDIYGFRIISQPAGLYPSFPSSAIFYDTLISSIYPPTINYIAFQCSTAATFDLDIAGFNMTCGRHEARGNILVENNYCNPENATVTMTFSPQYQFAISSPAPATVVGNTATWTLSAVSTFNPPAMISYVLSIPGGLSGTYLSPGDTIHASVVVTPTTGDADTTNNYVSVLDTVFSSYDPNYMSVQPSGYIAGDTTLSYSISFENTGNDTAFNIHVLDTLSGYVNPSTIQIIGSSAVMNTSVNFTGGMSIVKFDFPGINLLDSSHHGSCDGMVSFKINTLSSLLSGTNIYNRAGIYFDDNPVVMTNRVDDIVAGPSTISIIATADTFCQGTMVGFSATAGTDSSYFYSWMVNNTLVGTDSSGLIINTLNNSDTIICKIVSTTDSNVLATSNAIIVFVNPVIVPTVGTVSGSNTVCAGDTVLLSEATTGGTWIISNSHATIADSMVVAATSGMDTVMYVVVNTCASDTAKFAINISALPFNAPISGADTVCIGAPITLTEDSAGGNWMATNGLATISGGIVTGINTGQDTIIYSRINACGSVQTLKMVYVNVMPVLSAISGADSVCAGLSILLTEDSATGIWSTSNGHATLSGDTVIGISRGLDSIIYSTTNTCGTTTAVKMVYVNTIAALAAIAGPDSVCIGAPITLTEDSAGGIWSANNSDATVTGGVVSGITTGLDTIRYTINNTCGTNFTLSSIYVNEIPVVAPITGADSVCAGSAVTLTEDTSGGIWSASNGHATISAGVVSGITTGLDTIIYTDGNTCGTNIAVKMVYINAIAMLSGITGNDSVCTGGTITLTEDSTGGTWSSANSHATVSGGIVRGVDTGIDTITYSKVNTCGSDPEMHQVYVNARPVIAAISGTFTICVGSAVSLTDSTNGGIWYASNSHATVSGGFVTPSTIGTDSIYYTLSNTCGTDTASQLITILTTPTVDAISGESRLCNGSSITLADGIPGGSWSSIGGHTNVISGIVTALSVGTDTITYINTNICGADTAYKLDTVTISPTAILSTDYYDSIFLCAFDSARVYDSVAGGTWACTSSAATINSSGLVNVFDTGLVTITYTLPGGCSVIQTFHAVYCPGSVPLVNATNGYRIYPNPANKVLNIEILSNTYDYFTITNNLGQILLSQPLSHDFTQIDITSLPAGLYFIMLKGNSGNIVEKVIKE